LDLATEDHEAILGGLPSPCVSGLSAFRWRSPQ